MKVAEGKQKFIHTWGRLGANWGINRTMASVHALLLVSADAMNADEIMAELKISRGNANMNLRELMNWGLVHKEIIRGDRKEYFVAEKKLVKVAKLIMKERRKRELDPIVKTLAELQTIEGDKKDKHVKAYLETVKGLKDLTTKADGLIELMLKADESRFLNLLIKLLT